MVEFERPTHEHLVHVANNMRPEDIAEVWACNRNLPLEALEKAMEKSQYAVTVIIDGAPMAIYGLHVQDMLTQTGVPWMLATTQAVGYRRQFLELSPGIVAQMLEVCQHLENWVHADNHISIRWLDWLGFIIDPAQPVGPSGELFHRFHRERSH